VHTATIFPKFRFSSSKILLFFKQFVIHYWFQKPLICSFCWVSASTQYCTSQWHVIAYFICSFPVHGYAGIRLWDEMKSFTWHDSDQLNAYKSRQKTHKVLPNMIQTQQGISASKNNFFCTILPFPHTSYIVLQTPCRFL